MEPLIVINGDVRRPPRLERPTRRFNGAVDRDQRRHDAELARDAGRRRASMEPLIVINGDASSVRGHPSYDSQLQWSR